MNDFFNELQLCDGMNSSWRSFDLHRVLRCHGSSDFRRRSSALLRDFFNFDTALGDLLSIATVVVRKFGSSVLAGYGSACLSASAFKQLLYRSDRVKRW